MKLTLVGLSCSLAAACADAPVEAELEPDAALAELEAAGDHARTPTVLAAGQEFPVDVELDHGKVYWANAVGVIEDDDSPRPIRSTSKAPGGAVVDVAISPPFLGAIEVDAERVYWGMGAGEEGVGGLQSRTKDGGPVVDLIEDMSVFAFVVGGDDLYVASPDAGGILFKMPKTGGPLEVLAEDVGPGLANIPFLALGGDRLFVSLSTFETECDGQVRFVPSSGGEMVTVAHDICGLLGMTADSRSVYWTEFDPVEQIGRIVRLEAPFTGTPTVLATPAGEPFFVEVDRTHVYYATISPADGAGEIRKVQKRGGGDRALATGQLFPSSLAVDSSHVYWTTMLDGEVKRVRK